MSPKCVETIYHPSLWDEEIVHPLEKSWDKVHHQHHNWHRYGLGYPAKSSKGNCGSRDLDRCCNEHWIEEGLKDDPVEKREAPGGVKSSLVSFIMRVVP